MSVQKANRIVSSDGLLLVTQLEPGDFNYDYTGDRLQLVAQDAVGAKKLVQFTLGGGVPGQLSTNSTFTAGSNITAGQLLVVDTTGANKLVPASFAGAPAVAVAKANAASGALVDALLFGAISVKAGGNFSIGAVLKSNLNAEVVTATALNLGASPAVDGSPVIGYALTAGTTGNPCTILFVGGCTVKPTNYQ